MLDPIIEFFTRAFRAIGRGIGVLIGFILWPFLWAGRWYTQRSWILRGVIGLILLGIVGLYGYFFYVTQFWTNFNPDYPSAIVETGDTIAAGDEVPAGASGQASA